MDWGVEEEGIRYLSCNNLIAINVEAMSITPTEHVGVFKPDQLESLQQKPSMYRYYEKCDDVYTLAAVLFIGVAQGHCFENGNKRTAFIASSVFLLANGFMFEPCTESSIETVINVVKKVPGYCDPSYLSSWFKAFSREIGSDSTSLIIETAKNLIKEQVTSD